MDLAGHSVRPGRWKGQIFWPLAILSVSASSRWSIVTTWFVLFVDATRGLSYIQISAYLYFIDVFFALEK